MNIQIFGTKKSFDTKKAQRYFKERRIKVQFIDLKEKEMSKGELQSVMRAVGGIDAWSTRTRRTRTRWRSSPTLPRARSSTSCSRTSRSCASHRAQRSEGDGGVLPGRLEDLGIRRACGWWLW